MITDDDRQGYVVSPRSWHEIYLITADVRRDVGCYDKKYLDVRWLLEDVLDCQRRVVQMQVLPISEMGGAEGLTCPQGNFIRLSEPTYIGACDGDGQSRFTIAHELGHWYLHSGQQAIHPAMVGQHRPFERSEPQANQFAAELLMPSHLITGHESAEDIAREFGVSKQAASYRLNSLFGKKGRVAHSPSFPNPQNFDANPLGKDLRQSRNASRRLLVSCLQTSNTPRQAVSTTPPKIEVKHD